MATSQDIIKIASNEIGYTEGKNNDNKYGKEYGLNNAPWCVIFIWWCFKHTDASNLFYDSGKVASCTKVYEWAKKAGLIVTKPQIGDLVIFDWNKDKVTDHIGIIEKVSGSTLYTIEGNTGDNSASDGEGVYRRTRKTSSVYCYIRPKYEEKSYVWTKPVAYLPQLSKGDKNEYVAVLQSMLNAKGFNCGEVDGDFGNNTFVAVKNFQNEAKLMQNGNVGTNVWSALFKKQ